MSNISTLLLAHASWRVFRFFSLMEQLHPTPALAGQPVGEALMSLREIESYNRGFFGGAIGVVDAEDNGEFSSGDPLGRVRRW